MLTTIYRNGRKLTGNARSKTIAKTLSTTGEHDLWSGSAATMPQPDDGPLSLVSTSAQDAALTPDTWTVSEEVGIDPQTAITVDGVEHSCVTLPGDDGLERLIDAVNDGSADTHAVIIATLPDNGDDVVVSVGATDYTVERDSELTTDELATAIAAAMAADPDYDAAAPGGGSGAVVLTAKAPAEAAPVVSVDFLATGSGSSVQLVEFGPPSAVVTAADVAGDCVLTAIQRGVVYEVTADTDRASVVHTITAGAGTGIQSVWVEYIDGDGLYRRRLVEMLGTAANYPADDEATALLDCYAATVGTGGGAAGTITIGDDTPTELATIAQGGTEILRAEWQVQPEAGSPGVRNFVSIASIAATVTGAAATIRIRRTGGVSSGVAWQAALPAGGSEQWSFLDAPIVAGPGERLRVTVEGNGATITATVIAYAEGEAA